MLYRQYFEDIDTKGQREFFDSIAPQVEWRTMSADDQGLFVEYETHETRNPHVQEPFRSLLNTFSGESGNITLPVVIIGIAVYAIWFMISHGVFQAVTALQIK